MKDSLFVESLKNKKMQKGLFIVMGLFIVYRFLAHVPIPLAEPTQLKQLVSGALKNQQSLGFLDLLSGGALASFSIMTLGLGPYINASIIIQVLSKAIPKLEEKQKEGEQARRKINQYTRILTLPLAIGQSFGILTLLRQQTIASSLGVDISRNATISQWVIMITALTAGSMLLMWLGEIITEQGLGNGISLIIFAGIASSLPSTALSLWNTIKGTASDSLHVFGQTLPFSSEGLMISAGVIAFLVFLTYSVVKLSEAKRVITVYYAKRVRGGREYGGVTTVLPLKLISVGVIPIIFAQAILSALQFVASLLSTASNTTISSIAQKITTWLPSDAVASGQYSNTYIYVYFAMIFFFTYFYTKINFDPKQISEDLQKEGGFIENVKPGQKTQSYINNIMQRLTLTGAISIGLLAIIPIVAQRYISAGSIALMGTSLLIVVSVAVETIRQVQSKALMYSYDNKKSGDITLEPTATGLINRSKLNSTIKKRAVSLKKTFKKKSK
jgi:preprotein translocase subunit SecY